MTFPFEYFRQGHYDLQSRLETSQGLALCLKANALHIVSPEQDQLIVVKCIQTVFEISLVMLVICMRYMEYMVDTV